MSKRLVRVAGTCPAGHALERDADLDAYGQPRLTWRGECPTEGCALKMIARRIKNYQPPPAATATATPTPATTPPATPPARRAVRKVTAYRDAPTRVQPTRRTAHRKPAVVPATEPVPAVAQPVVDQRAAGGPDLDERPGRRPRRRLSFGGPDTRDADGFTIPGIY